MIDWSAPLEDWEKPLEAPSKKKESLKEKILRYGVKNPVAGTAKFGNKLLNIPSNLAELMGDRPSANMLGINKNFDYDKALGLPKEKNLGDFGTQLIPELLGAFAIPEANLGKLGSAIGSIPKAGKYINKVLSQGLPQAGYAGLMSEPENAGQSAAMAGATMAPFSVASQLAQSTSPWARRGAQALGGVLGYELGNEGAKHLGFHPLASNIIGGVTGALGARGFTTQKMMEDMLTHGMDPAKAKERLDASRRIGMDYLTPAEAGLSPFLAQEQGALGKTREGSKHLFDQSEKRLQSEEKSINNVLDIIYHEESMSPEIKRLYEEAYHVQLPPEFESKFADNELIKKATKTVEETPAFMESLKNIPKNSLAYWDHIKQALDDMAQAVPKKEAAIIKKTRNKMRDEMDLLSPEYKEARGLHERKEMRDTLESVFNKKGERTGTNFYKALNDEKKFNETMHHLRNVPEAQEKLKDMRLIFKNLIGSPSIKGAAMLEKTSMNKSRSSSQDIIHMLENKLTQGRYDKELIDFITNPNWDEMMKDINKISNGQKRMAKFLEYFGKSMAVSNTPHEPYMKTENYDFYE